MARAVERLASAQVMISQFVSSSPASGSVLIAQGLLRILSLPLSAPSPLALSLSLSLSQNKEKKENQCFLPCPENPWDPLPTMFP